jgi:hypothetical protein
MTYYKGQQVYLRVGSISKTAPIVYRTGPITYGESARYAGYPLYGHFAVTDAEKANKFSTDYSGFLRLNSSKKYWNPYFAETGIYQEYNEGDENVYWVFNKAPTVSIFQIPGVNPVSANGPAVITNPVSRLPDTVTSIIYASETYRATNNYVEWNDLGITNPAFFNPYPSTRIQLWVKFDPTKNATIGNTYYYYRPDSKQFYSIPTTTKIYDSRISTKSIEQGKITSLVLQGNTAAQAVAQIESPSGAGDSAAGSPGTVNNTAVTNKNGSSTTNASTKTTANAPIKATVRVRGNFGFINPGEPDGGSPQMVQYYRQGTSQLQEPDRHIFSPKPNQINYQNIGSEWTEIERVGRIPLIDWKNFRLMKISFQFIVIPDATYRLGAYGATADDGITLSIDDKLDTLRNMATRPYPVILFGFDELLTNSSQFSNSAGSGVQFVINDFSISSVMRTPTGAVNRATCDITLQEVPIEYINLITMPRLVPGQILAARNTTTETTYGARESVSANLPPRTNEPTITGAGQ